MNILTLQGITTDKVLNPLGQLGVVSQQEKLIQDIRTLLLTEKGSVLGNPEYGSNLNRYLFDTLSESTISNIKSEIQSAINNNYGSLNNTEIETEIKDNGLYVTVVYTTLNTDLSSSLEFTIPISKQGGISYE